MSLKEVYIVVVFYVILFFLDSQNSDCLLHGFLHKLGGPFQSVWTKKYFFLYPNRLEYRGEQAVSDLSHGTRKCLCRLECKFPSVKSYCIPLGYVCVETSSFLTHDHAFCWLLVQRKALIKRI